MAVPLKECFCHLLEIDKEPILPCSQVSWTKLYESARVWVSIDGLEKIVSVRILDNSDLVVPDIAGYHRRCYQRFTDLKRIRQGVSRKEKGRLRPPSELPDNSEISTSEPPAKLPTLRSNFLSSNSTRRSEHVLPKECIICRKTKKIVDRSTGKRKMEGLITCETDAEKLLGAAQRKGDNRILLQIGDLDPVCIEVRYHASCYKAYTKCVYDGKQTNVRPLTESFDIFCAEVIEKRLVSNGEVLKITHLTNMFIDTVKDVEGLDISGYRNFQLKDRLKKKYTDLEFIQPESRCCELVLYHSSDAANTSSLITMTAIDDIDSLSDTEEESELPFSHSFTQPSTQDEFADLYRAAIMVRNAIQASPSVTMWPPSANNLTLSKCLEIIPAKLFNFLAWSCGISDNFCTDKVEISSNDAQNKLLSLSQDVICLATQGRKLMPKHLALGMTVRHLTGSARLQNLLNAFGHCVSHSVTLEHDTALAAQQLRRESPVPHGFAPDVFTTLVWDNNDFGEETLTDRMELGKGTTHNTNGLIIQRASDVQPEEEECEPMSRDRKRTIDAPTPDIQHYHGQKRKGPVQFQGENLDLNRKLDEQEESTVTDRGYFLAKYCQTDELLPGWTGWNQVLHKDTHPINKIGYLPIIDASPTDKSTVNTILQKSLDIASALNLPSIVLVMDQAIYAKAQEIRWQGPTDFRDRIILRLGEFHTAMAFLGAVGKRFKDAGLLDVIIESGTVAEGSIAGVLSGHHYNRSLRTHKLICEALQRLRMQDYIGQLQESEYQDALMIMDNVQVDFKSRFLTAIQSDSVCTFLRSYQEYIDLRSRENAMFAFWSSYLEMIELLLRFLRATREGNWDLHLSCVRNMIPWFFAYGRINYSRYLPVYYFEMASLPSSHPSVYARLKDGEFAVKRHDDHGFAKTACDQVIEQTFNRDSKTRGCMTGITLNKGAVRRWILSHPARAGIASECYTMASGKNDTSSSQTDLLNSRIQTDEQAVQDIMATITGFSNPFTFQDNSDIVNISSGKVAPQNVKSDLSSAFNRGEECFKSFVKERLTDNQKDLYDSLTLPSCKTFSDIDRKLKSKQSFVGDSLKEHRNILSRLLVIAQEKGLDLKGVMAYPLSSVPHEVANFDGSMVKTSKATLLKELEKQVPSSQLGVNAMSSQENVLIIDAMAMIQQQRHFPETFGGFALSLLQQIVSLAKKYCAKRVDFVGDRYPDISTKGFERHDRSAHGETRVNINRPEQKMPKQMKKFLACGSNKEGLLKFVVDEWKGYQAHVFAGTDLYATYEDRCYKLYGAETTLHCEDVADLQSNQEEADTRMFLHASHCSRSSPPETSIIIRTVDTDVLVVALWASTILTSRLIVLLSLGNNTRALDVTEMSRTLGNETSKALVGLHPFTGCDSVSAFKGKGKVKALKLMMKVAAFQRTFMEIGKDLTVPQELRQDVERFVCELYGWTGCASVDDARYNCFRFGCTGETSMPPNSDSLALHLQRANYQAYLYRSCMLQTPRPSPAGHGWTLTASEISIKWTTMPVAPGAVLHSIHCGCTKMACDSAKCSCKKAGLVCTDMCRCDGCANRKLQQNNSDTDSD